MATKVKELMKANPIIVAPDSTLLEAAAKMKSTECGVLPVGMPGKLEGIITDRDIVIQAVAEGKDPIIETVRNHMTPEVFYCDPEDTLEQAAEKMHENNVSRLVVRDDDGKIHGILSFGCIIRKHQDTDEIGKVVKCAVGRNAA